MDRSLSLIGALVMFFFCIDIADLASSNGYVANWTALTKKDDIVIDILHDYLQGQEKRLANLRKYGTSFRCSFYIWDVPRQPDQYYTQNWGDIENYAKEHAKAIREMAKTLSAITQENSVSDDDVIKKDAEEGDVSILSQYAGSMCEKLCNGEKLLPAVVQKKLKCRYVDHDIPFLKITPFKEEEAYLDPRIVVYHDVLSEEEIETFKRLSESKLEPSLVQDITTGGGKISKVRISKSAWLKDYENKHVKLLNRRVEHLTGLTVKTGEDLQIAYYDIGGFYLPHHDFFGVENAAYLESFGGDRIATILFYMNDVAEGGGTAFPKLNFTIWPKKGSALFWHNLKRNGEPEGLSLHAACPVVSGTKWIATKWLNEAGQELFRPCTLLKNE